MSDLISRQAAIDALMAWEEDSIWDEECLKHRGEPYWNAPSDVIEQLPSAQPVRHGKWIDETFKPWGLVHHPFKCNLCGEHAEFASPYCPNCGARMDGDEND